MKTFSQKPSRRIKEIENLNEKVINVINIAINILFIRKSDKQKICTEKNYLKK